LLLVVEFAIGFTYTLYSYFGIFMYNIFVLASWFVIVPKHADLMPSENGCSRPKHVKAINTYKLNHTGWCYQLFYNFAATIFQKLKILLENGPLNWLFSAHDVSSFHSFFRERRY
jgi:hypothetical protein